MPEILGERGGHLPHRDYIARVVTELEERGPGGWWLEEADRVGGPTLHAVLCWGAGNHPRHGDPDAENSRSGQVKDGDLAVLGGFAHAADFAGAAAIRWSG